MPKVIKARTQIEFKTEHTNTAWMVLTSTSATAATLTPVSGLSFAKIPLGLNGGAASASGLLMGVGTTASPATTSTADAKFVELRCQSTATSGDNRLLYFRYDLDGGGGGECLRLFTELGTANVGTARGAHVSLEINTSARCTGLGIGVDAQINIETGAIGGGEYAVLNSEIWSGAASSDPAGVVISHLRCVNAGNASGIADVNDDALFLRVVGYTAEAGSMVDAASQSLKCSIIGSTRYAVLSQSEGKLDLRIGGAAASASGLLIGSGTSATPNDTSTADAKFIELRCSSSASSGDNRLAYFRYELDGGGGGECLRAFTDIDENNVGTARGAHISLQVGNGENVTGLGVGVDAQILIKAGALTAGTYGVLGSEIYSGDATSDTAGQVISHLRCVNGGDATGMADVDDDAFLIEVVGYTAGAAHLLSTSPSDKTNGAVNATLKVRASNTTYYIPLWDNADGS